MITEFLKAGGFVPDAFAEILKKQPMFAKEWKAVLKR
jgi:hypothetical protein